MIRAVVSLLVSISMISIAVAQTAPKKKVHILRGKVEAITPQTKSITVNHEAIEGWMGAMSMPYGVGDESALTKVKVGDQITANVYDGDYTLYDIEVVKAPAKTKKKK